MQLVDKCLVYFKAGDGGNGIVSWRREAHVPEGGPWGGDGGNGGSIILVGDHNMNSLFEFRNKRRIVAKNGGNGENELCGGKNATDLYVKVPLGTQVYDAKNNKLIVDIVKSDQQFILCFGGRGGHGNAYFKSVKNVAPSLHENGEIGEEINAILKLKFIADIGIIGLPNAGKSTLISTITNAHPKIANYQFTTLTPVLGIVNHNGKKIVFADIPGLIEGAAEGKGLGHDFLKHIERCNILIHLISGSCDDNKNILKAYETINEELKKYSKKISQKKMIVVINKSDIEESELNYEELKKNINGKVFLISALEKKGINELLTYIFNKYKPKKIILKKEKAREREYTKTAKIIRADKHTWEVKSDYLKYWAHRIPLDTKDNLFRFNQKMESVDVEKKAKNKGAKSGDALIVYGNELVVE